jgi:hypothetical protein
MPKKHYDFRLNESAILILTKYKKENCSLTDALENALQRLQYLEDLALEEPKIPENIPDCKRRLNYLGQDYCVQTSPIKGLQRLKEIVTLEICRICKLERWKIPESTQVKQAQQIAAEIKDPNRQGFKKAGLKFCPNDALWVYPSKCEKCKTPC